MKSIIIVLVILFTMLSGFLPISGASDYPIPISIEEITCQVYNSSSLAFDSQGNLYDIDCWKIVKISPEGEQTSIYPGTTAILTKVTCDAANNIFVAGNEFIAGKKGASKIWKVTPDGQFSQFTDLEAGVLDLAVGPDGSVYVLTLTTTIGGTYFFRYDSAGVLQNTHWFPCMISITFDSSGNLFVGGPNGIFQITQDGEPIRTYVSPEDLPPNTDLIRFGPGGWLYIDSDNDIYVAGKDGEVYCFCENTGKNEDSMAFGPDQCLYAGDYDPVTRNAKILRISIFTPGQQIATKLAFGTQTSRFNIVGDEFDIQPIVAIRDSCGNTVTTFNEPVALSITPGSGTEGAVLSGVTTVNAVNGLAVFKNLSIDRVGRDYTLTATCGIFTRVISSPFNIVPTELTIFTASPAKGLIYSDYSQALEATGGSGKGYLWSIINGSFPGWAILDTMTGIISGLPDTLGTSAFTIQVVDDEGHKATKEFSLIIYIEPEYEAINLPPAEVKAAYPPQKLQAVGGSPPYKWEKSGTWPAGLNISKDGVISDTPSVNISKATEYSISVKVTDSVYSNKTSTSGNNNAAGVDDEELEYSSNNQSISPSVSSKPIVVINHVAIKKFKITIHPALNITQTGSTRILTTLPDAYTNKLYSYSLAASGGKAPYIWSKGDDFPDWLNLDANTGKLSGTPITPDTKLKINIDIQDSLGYSCEKTLSFKINKGITITTDSLPSADVGVKYPSTSLKATGGKTPYTWSITGGALPEGLNMTKQGLISGVPKARTSGTYVLTFQVKDVTGTDSTQLSITINPELAIGNLPDGKRGMPYNQALADITSGGTGKDYKFIISNGLPLGLKFSTQTGIISGTPTKTGSYLLNVKVTDSLRGTVTKAIKLKIN